ncbi:hypothetical protein GS597_13805 [Synechococcales cyanobacterium C]|uniref:Uncharacterized protein n=1 Tax=Petrachloros mirabilis ULC683 TaxID=2781853 RepID=A0A8K2A935_9CYAN|nr:hypothetical protein [Petrachloros mirabilis]NCJ07565.1 hypothetical protein [Petrachloros mirabilis ULC683]
MLSLLRPTGWRLFWFGALVVLTLGAGVQGWTPPHLAPKPPLYDLLRPLPLWPLWVFLMLPIMIPFSLMQRFISQWGIDLRGGWWLVQLSYYYLAAGLLTAGMGRLRRR